MSTPFWGARFPSVCSSQGCSSWPGMGRGGIRFCAPNADMKPVLVLSQEQNAVCVSCIPRVPAVSKAQLHLCHCPRVFVEVSCLQPPRSVTASHHLGDSGLQQLNSIFNTLLCGRCFSLFLQMWVQELSFRLGRCSYP